MPTFRIILTSTLFSSFFFLFPLHAAATEDTEWKMFSYENDDGEVCEILMHRCAHARIRMLYGKDCQQFKKRYLINFSASSHAFQLLHNYIVDMKLGISISGLDFKNVLDPTDDGDFTEIPDDDFVTISCTNPENGETSQLEVHKQYFNSGTTEFEVNTSEADVIKQLGYKYLIYFIKNLDSLNRVDVKKHEATFHNLGLQCFGLWRYTF